MWVWKLINFLVVAQAALNLLEVTPQTVEKEAAKYDDMVVYFYTKWCEHCRTFEPDVLEPVIKKMTKISKKLGVSPPGFVKMDSTIEENRRFAAPRVGDMYPSLILFHKGKFDIHIRTDNTVDSIYQWLRQYTGPVVERWTASLEREFPVVFTGRFSSEKSTAFNVYREFAADHRYYGKFLYLVDGDSSEETVTITHSSDAEDAKTVVLSSASDAEKVKSELEDFCNRNRFPLFGEMNTANQHLYYLRKLNPIMLIGTEDHFKKYSSSFKKVAEHFMNQFSVVWYRADSTKAPGVTHFKLPKLPGLVIFTGTGAPRNHRRYIAPKSVELADFESVIKFVERVQNKQERPLTKSSGMPPSDRVYHPKNIKFVTGDSFERDVLDDRSTDTMLIFTAPKGNEAFVGCVECEGVLREFDALVPLLEKACENEDGEEQPCPLRFHELMVTQNEIPIEGWGTGDWELKDLPLIYYVKGNDTTQVPQQIAKPLLIPDILDFWTSHTDLALGKNKPVKEKIMQMVQKIKSDAPESSIEKKDEL